MLRGAELGCKKKKEVNKDWLRYNVGRYGGTKDYESGVVTRGLVRKIGNQRTLKNGIPACTVTIPNLAPCNLKRALINMLSDLDVATRNMSSYKKKQKTKFVWNL